MCSDNDTPPYGDVDWRHIRWTREQREDELRRGIPPMEENQKQLVRDMAVEARRGWRFDPSEREGVIRREADRLHHSQARRGFEYHE